MGLDMYLERHRSGYGKNLSQNFDDYKSDKFGRSNRVEIKENCGYWRKANAIHKWFVDKVQDGNDDCREYDVSVEELKTLRDTCKKIIDKMDGVRFYIPDELWKTLLAGDERHKEDCKQVNEPYKPVKRIKEFIFKKSKIASYYDNETNGIYHYSIDVGKELDKLIKDELPSQSGFFFGSTDIDGCYAIDIIKTYLMLDEILKEYNRDKKGKKADYWFTYQASW